MHIPDLEGVELDSGKRIKYHPELHPNQGKPFTVSEYEYLCKYAEVDDLRTLSFALGRTERTIAKALKAIRDAGEYDYYKNLNTFW